MPWLLGIDLGAGSLKSMIVDHRGRVGGSASLDITTFSPRPGWSEQDPAEWWRALCETVPRALSAAGLSPGEIVAVSFSAGAHTPVLEDSAGRVLRPAILWSDQRSGAQARALRAQHDARILALGKNRVSPTWTLAQLRWLIESEPEVAGSTRRIYVAKDWLRSRLTDTWETDRTEAVGTLLFDPERDAWSDELCAMIGWDPATLPPIVSPTSVVGRVTARAAAQCGLAAGMPVVCGTSDTSAETFGAGSINVGDGTIKLATAGTVSVVGACARVDPALINYPLVIPDRWYTLTATNSCASAHRWLRDQFFMHPGASGAQVFADMDAMATAVAPGAQGLLFHPYLQGERAPHWDPLLRADFIGMTFRHDRRHFVRALYEGIACSLREALEPLRAQGSPVSSARIIGGGARSATWRRIVADVLDIEVALPEVTDASFGAALIAGIGVGVFSGPRSAVRDCVRIAETLSPLPLNRGIYDELFGLYQRAQQALAPINHGLAVFDRPSAGQ